MSPLYLHNNKLLVVDGKLAANEACCCIEPPTEPPTETPEECSGPCEANEDCPAECCCVDGECQDAVIGSCLSVTGTILFTCDFSPSFSRGSCEQNVRECDCPEECAESPAGCFGECPFDTPREECENNPECEFFVGDPTVLIEFRPSNDCPCGEFTFCSGGQVCCDNICQEGPCDP